MEWKKIAWIFISIVIATIILWFFWEIVITMKMWMLAALIALAIMPLIILALAKKDIFFTFVEEGTTKAVVRGGQFRYFLIAWLGYTFKITVNGTQSAEEKNWDVVKGKEKWHPFGGLRFYGFWPFDRIFEYRQQWTNLAENGEERHHDEFLDLAILKTNLYVVDYPLTEKEAAEDIDGVPIGIKLVIPMQIMNPYIALFRVRRWLPIINGVIKATLRKFVSRYRLKEDLQAMVAGKGIEDRQRERGIKETDLDKVGDDITAKLWKNIKKALMEKAEEEGEEIEDLNGDIVIFGVRILQRGTDILKLDPDESYRKETTKRYVAERDKEVTIINAEAQALAAENISKGKALESAMMHREIVRILTENKGVDKEKAEKIAYNYVKYWKGTEERAVLDWKLQGSGAEKRMLAGVAEMFAVIEAAKKEIERQLKEQRGKE